MIGRHVDGGFAVWDQTIAAPVRRDSASDWPKVNEELDQAEARCGSAGTVVVASVAGPHPRRPVRTDPHRRLRLRAHGELQRMPQPAGPVLVAFGPGGCLRKPLTERRATRGEEGQQSPADCRPRHDRPARPRRSDHLAIRHGRGWLLTDQRHHPELRRRHAGTAPDGSKLTDLLLAGRPC